MLNVILIKKILQWLLLGSLTSWYVQCNYSSEEHDTEYHVQLETLDTFEQNVSDFSAGEPIELQLSLHNTGANDLYFQFTSTQQFEFYVYPEDDTLPVWQWSVAESMFFIPAITSHTVPENSRWIESVIWNQTDNDGNPVSAGIYHIEATFFGIATKRKVVHIF